MSRSNVKIIIYNITQYTLKIENLKPYSLFHP